MAQVRIIGDSKWCPDQLIDVLVQQYGDVIRLAGPEDLARHSPSDSLLVLCQWRSDKLADEVISSVAACDNAVVILIASNLPPSDRIAGMKSGVLIDFIQGEVLTFEVCKRWIDQCSIDLLPARPESAETSERDVNPLRFLDAVNKYLDEGKGVAAESIKSIDQGYDKLGRHLQECTVQIARAAEALSTASPLDSNADLTQCISITYETESQLYSKRSGDLEVFRCSLTANHIRVAIARPVLLSVLFGMFANGEPRLMVLELEQGNSRVIVRLNYVSTVVRSMAPSVGQLLALYDGTMTLEGENTIINLPVLIE